MRNKFRDFYGLKFKLELQENYSMNFDQTFIELLVQSKQILLNRSDQVTGHKIWYKSGINLV
jgi:hypothetical protein